MNDQITKEKLIKYFGITDKALKMARDALVPKYRTKAEDFLDMAQRYFDDANHFEKQGDYVNAFGAINYAQAWLDAGARIGFFDVHDSTLFTVDD